MCCSSASLFANCLLSHCGQTGMILGLGRRTKNDKRWPQQIISGGRGNVGIDEAMSLIKKVEASSFMPQLRLMVWSCQSVYFSSGENCPS